MKTSNFKTVLFLVAFIFLNISLAANSTDPPYDKGNIEINVEADGVVSSVSVVECCETMTDFDFKKNNAMKTLTVGYGEKVKTHKAGNYIYHDFRKGNKQVARIVVNQNEKILMLITYEFK